MKKIKVAVLFGGLVIKEGANEYVFMPCTEENYTEDSSRIF